MRRTLFTLAARASAVLCVGACALWMMLPSCERMPDEAPPPASEVRARPCAAADGLQLCMVGSALVKPNSLQMGLSLTWVAETSLWAIRELDRVTFTFYDESGTDIGSITTLVRFPPEFTSGRTKSFAFLAQADVPANARFARASFGTLVTPRVPCTPAWAAR